LGGGDGGGSRTGSWGTKETRGGMWWCHVAGLVVGRRVGRWWSVGASVNGEGIPGGTTTAGRAVFDSSFTDVAKQLVFGGDGAEESGP
jgi:hypothetical protein